MLWKCLLGGIFRILFFSGLVCFFKRNSSNRKLKLVSGEETGCIEDTPADPGLRTDTVEFHTYRIQGEPVAVCEHYVRRFCKLSNTLIL